MRCISFFIIIFSTHFLFAQISDSTTIDSSLKILLPVFKSEAVIVTATRISQPVIQTPYAIDAYEIKAIQDNGKNISLQEALQSVPGLFVSDRNNFALGDRLSIRGIGARSSFGIRGIKILMDDIPLTMPDGQTQLNNLDLGSAAKIEVIKGASSSLYGNAAGGIISVQSEQASDSIMQLSPRVVAGSYDLLRLQGKITGIYNNSNYMVNFNKFGSSGFRENSAVSSWSVNAVNRYKYSKQLQINGLVNIYNSPYALNPGSLSKEAAENSRTSSRYFIKQQGASEQARQIQGGITLIYKPADSSHLKITVYGLNRSLKNPIPSRIIELDRLAGGIRTAYSDKHDINNIQLTWTAGIDAEIQSDQRKEFTNLGLADDLVDNIENSRILKKIRYGDKLQHQDEQVASLGPFVNFSLPFSKKWIFSAGSRYDYYNFKIKDLFLKDNIDDSGDITMSQFSPMAGLIYMLRPTHSIYLNFSTAFQTPTTSELGNSPLGNSLNSNLEPERIKNFELGIKGIVADFAIYYQVSLYYMQILDMLIPYQNDLSEEVFYRNAGRAQNTGIEMSMEWQMNPALKLQLSYTRMDFIYSDYRIDHPLISGQKINFKNNKVPGIAPQTFFTALTYNHPSDFFTMIQLNWTDACFTNDFNGPAPGENYLRGYYINNEYISVNARMAKTWSFKALDLHLFMGIDNLFDNKYNGSVVPNAVNNNFFEPAAGRTWYGGIKLVL